MAPQLQERAETARQPDNTVRPFVIPKKDCSISRQIDEHVIAAFRPRDRKRSRGKIFNPRHLIDDFLDRDEAIYPGLIRWPKTPTAIPLRVLAEVRLYLSAPHRDV